MSNRAVFAALASLLFWGTGCRPPLSANGAAPPPGPPKATRPSGDKVTPPPVRVGASSPSVQDDQMLLGNPDNATENPNARERFLLRRTGFAASYNDTLRFPNWVSWRLSAADIGDVERGQFKPDIALPDGFTRITPSDYTNSGFDRGHNCPSKDRTRTREDNDGAFVMTNITPQTHAMNAGPWENLESYCRALAMQGNELYIVCGHGFSGKYKTIGPAKVAVPQWGWKVVVVVPEQAGDDRQRIKTGARVIAVRMPNTNLDESDPWTKYIISPGEIERATGLRLFTGLDSSVANTLRQTRDTGVTETVKSTANKPDNSGASAGVRVWVNTKSGAYWKPGTRYYGKTKQGKFMREADALREGFHPAEP